MIKRLGDGRWLVDVEPQKNKRIRKRFSTKAEALRFERHVRFSLREDSTWLVSTKDKRRLSVLFQDWYNLYGHSLRDGVRRHAALQAIASGLGDPVGSVFTGKHFSAYRSARSASGISSKTLNNHLGYVKSAFNELRSIGHVAFDNPLSGVKPLRVQERELSWLTVDQIGELLASIRSRTENPHVEVITLVCLATGCRWSEAEGLTIDKLRNGSVVFTSTKSGKVRTIPIDAVLMARLSFHLARHGVMTSSLTAFRRALARTSIKLPTGQASHVLRHTFASHFVMRGGNILTLQKILGHSTVLMTMRYAHLAPGHLREAVQLSPLNLIDTFSTNEKSAAS